MPNKVDLMARAAQSLDNFQGAMLIAAAFLVVLLILLLPVNKKKLVRLPLALLLAYLLLKGLERLLPPDIDEHLPLGFTATVLLLFSIGRSGTLFVFCAYPLYYLTANLPRILLDVVQCMVYVGAFLIALHFAGVEPTSLVTGSALVTAAIGLSMRDTLGNLFAGLAIQAQRPFEIGDWIQFDEHQHHIGEVVEINWRVTKLITLDKVELTIPNGELAQSPIRNFTKPQRFSRRSIYVVAPYDEPPKKVQQIILDAVSDAWGVLADPPPSVVTLDFTERGIQYWVRVFTNAFDQRDRVDGAVRDRIWYALQRHGIKIPGPIRQVQLEHLAESELRDEKERYDDRNRALRRVDFLEELSDEQIAQLAASARRRVYTEGETILRRGERGSELFIIDRGHAAVYSPQAGGIEAEVNRLGPDDFFGELSCLTGEPRSATVRAITDCEVFVVDKTAFQPILEAAPELANHMSEVLAHRQAELARHSRDGKKTVISETQQRTVLLDRIKEFFAI